ncbi:MAG TPA: peptidoglycan-binding domain-containing protein [Candidatus Omnitrophota bacterium]|nr:peptidoglycan-binding domain-containing protein [Candidatus Omnitrophota bacterium]
MKKFYLIIIAGMIIFIAGCGRNKPTDMTSPDELSKNQEIIILDEESEDEILTQEPRGTAAQLLLKDPNPSATMVIEKPSDEQIQQALQNAGFYQGAIDGKIGPKSKKAIREFQEQNGLSVDGKVGKKTWAKLGQYLNTQQTTSKQ